MVEHRAAHDPTSIAGVGRNRSTGCDGPGNAPIYRAATGDAERTDAGAVYVPRAVAGRATRAFTTRPTAQRPPAGYHREMLFSYRPGTKW